MWFHGIGVIERVAHLPNQPLFSYSQGHDATFHTFKNWGIALKLRLFQIYKCN
jgi:hypothetical protein